MQPVSNLLPSLQEILPEPKSVLTCEQAWHNLRHAFDEKLRGTQRIFQYYRFPSEIEGNVVTQFLLDNAFLIPLLLEGFNCMQWVFGEGTEAVLQLVADPEEDFEKLFVVVLTDMPLQDVLERLDRLEEEWFLDVLPETKGLLGVTFEPKHAF